VLDEILSGKGRDEVVDVIHTYLRTKADEIRKDLIPIQKFVITKGLTKDLKEYADAKGQPHVTVANRLKQAVCYLCDDISFAFFVGSSFTCEMLLF
jgi:DNA polymerase alpha subunit A